MYIIIFFNGHSYIFIIKKLNVLNVKLIIHCCVEKRLACDGDRTGDLTDSLGIWNICYVKKHMSHGLVVKVCAAIALGSWVRFPHESGFFHTYLMLVKIIHNDTLYYMLYIGDV